MPESFLDYEENSFVRKDGGKMLGLNHHWYGHILASVVKYILGLREIDVREKKITLSPYFWKEINRISAVLDYADETIKVSWKTQGERALLKINTSYAVDPCEEIGEYRLTEVKNTRKEKRYLYKKKGE